MSDMSFKGTLAATGGNEKGGTMLDQHSSPWLADLAQLNSATVNQPHIPLRASLN